MTKTATALSSIWFVLSSTTTTTTTPTQFCEARHHPFTSSITSSSTPSSGAFFFNSNGNRNRQNQNQQQLQIPPQSLPLLEEWSFDTQSKQLTGVVVGHPVVPDGEIITTAAVLGNTLPTLATVDNNENNNKKKQKQKQKKEVSEQNDDSSSILLPIVTTIKGTQYRLGSQDTMTTSSSAGVSGGGGPSGVIGSIFGALFGSDSIGGGNSNTSSSSSSSRRYKAELQQQSTQNQRERLTGYFYSTTMPYDDQLRFLEELTTSLVELQQREIDLKLQQERQSKTNSITVATAAVLASVAYVNPGGIVSTTTQFVQDQTTPEKLLALQSQIQSTATTTTRNVILPYIEEQISRLEEQEQQQEDGTTQQQGDGDSRTTVTSASSDTNDSRILQLQAELDAQRRTNLALQDQIREMDDNTSNNAATAVSSSTSIGGGSNSAKDVVSSDDTTPTTSAQLQEEIQAQISKNNAMEQQLQEVDAVDSGGAATTTKAEATTATSIEPGTTTVSKTTTSNVGEITNEINNNDGATSSSSSSSVDSTVTAPNVDGVNSELPASTDNTATKQDHDSSSMAVVADSNNKAENIINKKKEDSEWMKNDVSKLASSQKTLSDTRKAGSNRYATTTAAAQKNVNQENTIVDAEVISKTTTTAAATTKTASLTDTDLKDVPKAAADTQSTVSSPPTMLKVQTSSPDIDSNPATESTSVIRTEAVNVESIGSAPASSDQSQEQGNSKVVEKNDQESAIGKDEGAYTSPSATAATSESPPAFVSAGKDKSPSDKSSLPASEASTGPIVSPSFLKDMDKSIADAVTKFNGAMSTSKDTYDALRKASENIGEASRQTAASGKQIASAAMENSKIALNLGQQAVDTAVHVGQQVGKVVTDVSPILLDAGTQAAGVVVQTGKDVSKLVVDNAPTIVDNIVKTGRLVSNTVTETTLPLIQSGQILATKVSDQIVTTVEDIAGDEEKTKKALAAGGVVAGATIVAASAALSSKQNLEDENSNPNIETLNDAPGISSTVDGYPSLATNESKQTVKAATAAPKSSQDPLLNTEPPPVNPSYSSSSTEAFGAPAAMGNGVTGVSPPPKKVAKTSFGPYVSNATASAFSPGTTSTAPAIDKEPVISSSSTSSLKETPPPAKKLSDPLTNPLMPENKFPSRTPVTQRKAESSSLKKEADVVDRSMRTYDSSKGSEKLQKKVAGGAFMTSDKTDRSNKAEKVENEPTPFFTGGVFMNSDKKDRSNNAEEVENEPTPFFSDTSGNFEYSSVIAAKTTNSMDPKLTDGESVPFFTDTSSSDLDLDGSPSIDMMYQALGMTNKEDKTSSIRPIESNGLLQKSISKKEGAWEKETEKKLNDAIQARLEAEAVLASVEMADSESNISPTEAYSVLTSDPLPNSQSENTTSSYGVLGKNMAASARKESIRPETKPSQKSKSKSSASDPPKKPASPSPPPPRSKIPRRIFTTENPSSPSKSSRSSVSLTDKQSVEERMVEGPGKAQAEWNKGTTMNARPSTSSPPNPFNEPKSRSLTDRQSVEERMVEGPGKAQAEWNRASTVNFQRPSSRSSPSKSSSSSGEPRSRSLTDTKSVEERMVESPSASFDEWKKSTTINSFSSFNPPSNPPSTSTPNPTSNRGRRDQSKKPDLKPIDIESVLFEVDDALKAAESSLSTDKSDDATNDAQ